MTNGHSVKRRNLDDEEECETVPPPDGGWGWMVVFGSFMIHIITDGVTYAFGVFYDEFLTYFKEGKAATAWILSILVGVTLCSGPISSSFVNRWGCRPVTIAGAIIATICMILSTFAKNIKTLYFTIGIGTGFGFGLIYLPAIVSVTTYFEKKRSLATGIAVCGSGFGTFIFAPIITKLLEEYGWRGAMLIIAGIVLECIIFGALFRPLETKYPKNANLNRRGGGTGTRHNNDDDDDDDECNVKISLKKIDGKIDIHVSEHNLYKIGDQTLNNIHRPHSMGHFSIPRGIKLLEHTNNCSGIGNNLMITNNGNCNETTRLALSQPMLTQSDNTFKHHHPHHNHYHRHHHNQNHNHNNYYQQQEQFGSENFKRHYGPIDRVDVFYQGSLMNIPSYRSKSELHPHSSMYLHRRHSNTQKNHIQGVNDKKSLCCDLMVCSQETKDTLMEMLDFSLFKDSIFILFLLSNFLTSIGFNIPYVYIVPKAKNLNLTKDQASMLLSIIGIANTIGRIVLGYLSDKPWVNRLMVYNWCLTVCGIATTLSAFCPTFYTLALYGTVFGFTIGAYVGLTSVILVDLLGLDKLTNAFGLLLLFQGISSLIGPPMAGALYDITLSYDPAFYLAGISISLSGIILFFIPVIYKYQERKEQKQSVDI